MGLVGGRVAKADALDASLNDRMEGGSSASGDLLLVHGTLLVDGGMWGG